MRVACANHGAIVRLSGEQSAPTSALVAFCEEVEPQRQREDGRREVVSLPRLRESAHALARRRLARLHRARLIELHCDGRRRARHNLHLLAKSAPMAAAAR